jgi:hypothetical protein
MIVGEAGTLADLALVNMVKARREADRVQATKSARTINDAQDRDPEPKVEPEPSEPGSPGSSISVYA